MKQTSNLEKRINKFFYKKSSLRNFYINVFFVRKCEYKYWSKRFYSKNPSEIISILFTLNFEAGGNKYKVEYEYDREMSNSRGVNIQYVYDQIMILVEPILEKVRQEAIAFFSKRFNQGLAASYNHYRQMINTDYLKKQKEIKKLHKNLSKNLPKNNIPFKKKLKI